MQAPGKIIACFGFVLVACFAPVLGAGAQATPGAGTALQAETVERPVDVVICLDDACMNREAVDGATVTAYDIETGEAIDSCETDSGASFPSCVLTAPADASTYSIEVDSGLDPEQYTALEPVGEDGVLRYGFAPIDDSTPETVEVPVNVIICDDDSCLCLDSECASPRTLDGAVVTSFDAAGTQVDSCTVSSEFEDFDGCFLDILEDGSASFEVAAPVGTEGYVLKSLEPEYIANLDLRLWSFIPDGAEPTAAPTEAPATTEPTAASTAAPVTALPKTGAGHDSGSQGALIVLGIGGVVALALAGMSARLVRR